jgi:hypothetical protein
MTEMLSTDLSNSQSFHWFISACPGLEVEGISAGQLGREKLGFNGRIGLFCRSSQ